MPVDPSRLCQCHGEPMYFQPCTGKSVCNQARVLEKRRYRQGANGKARQRERSTRRNPLRVGGGGAGYIGTAKTHEQALRARATLAAIKTQLRVKQAAERTP